MSWVCILIYLPPLPPLPTLDTPPLHKCHTLAIRCGPSETESEAERERERKNYKGEKVYFAKSVAETFIKWPKPPKCLEAGRHGKQARTAAGAGGKGTHRLQGRRYVASLWASAKRTRITRRRRRVQRPKTKTKTKTKMRLRMRLRERG